jgi:NAD(P)-dependent dehydrogenase (short-subunit alcohol dehydrogenase family)
MWRYAHSVFDAETLTSFLINFLSYQTSCSNRQLHFKMPIEKYNYKGPIDHTVPIDSSRVAGKSVIITGGANGMGETCVRHFAAAGANVTIADVNKRGYEIADELNKEYGSGRTVFVEVDIRDWDQQKHMFDIALTKFGAIDIVIANAGISRSSGDSLWNLDDPNEEPVKPDLRIMDVNLKGSFYTWKLAVHYWRKQKESEDRDRCFIITGSMVGWIDSPVGSESITHCCMLSLHRATGSIPRRSTRCTASCVRRDEIAGNKVFGSITWRHVGSEVRSVRKSTKLGWRTTVLTLASKKT